MASIRRWNGQIHKNKGKTVKHGEYLCSWIKNEFMRNEAPSFEQRGALHVPQNSLTISSMLLFIVRHSLTLSFFYSPAAV